MIATYIFVLTLIHAVHNAGQRSKPLVLPLRRHAQDQVKLARESAYCAKGGDSDKKLLNSKAVALETIINYPSESTNRLGLSLCLVSKISSFLLIGLSNACCPR